MCLFSHGEGSCEGSCVSDDEKVNCAIHFFEGFWTQVSYQVFPMLGKFSYIICEQFVQVLDHALAMCWSWVAPSKFLFVQARTVLLVVLVVIQMFYYMFRKYL